MIKLRHTLLCALMLSGAFLSITSCSDDDDDKNTVNPGNIPDSYIEALQKAVPGVDLKSVSWERKGTYRVAEFTKNMVDYDVWFTESSTWAMTEKDYGQDLFMVPDNDVLDAFGKSQFSNWKLDDISHYKRPTDEFYVIEVEYAGQNDTDLFYATDGTLLKIAAADGAPEITPASVIP